LFKSLIDMCIFFPYGTEMKTIIKDKTVQKNVQKEEKIHLQLFCIMHLEKRKEKM